MAEITFPPGVQISSADVGMSWPGQVVHESPFTGAVQVLNRSAGLWSGTMRFGIPDSEGAANDTEALLAALQGRANWTRLPLLRPTIEPLTADSLISGVGEGFHWQWTGAVSTARLSAVDLPYLIGQPLAVVSTVADATLGAGVTVSATASIAVDAARRYLVSGWYHQDGPRNSRIGVEFLDSAGAALSASTWHFAWQATPRWAHQSAVFGLGGTIAVPTGAVAMRPRAILATSDGLSDPTLAAAPCTAGVTGLRIDPVPYVESSTTGATITHTVADAARLQRGMFVAAGSRRCIVREVEGSTVTLDPQIILANNTNLIAAYDIAARRAESRPIMTPRTPDYRGPWALPWVEDLA